MKTSIIQFTPSCFIIILMIIGSGDVSQAQTFGNGSVGSTGYPTTNIGTTSTTVLGSFSMAAGTLSAQVFTIPTGGVTIKSVAVYWQSVSSDQVRFAFYTNSGGNPATLISGTEIGPVSATSGWQTITYSTPFYLSAGTYWVARQSTSNAVRSYNLTGGSGRRSRTFTFGAFPTSFGTPTTSDGLMESEYITYVRIEGFAKATKATLADANACIASMSFYTHSTGNFRLAIYDGTSAPGNKLWESTSTAAVASSWNTVAISTGTPSLLTLNNNTYWLSWQWDSPTLGPSYTAGSSGTGNYLIQAYGSYPSAWSGGTSTSEQWSIYAIYTVKSAPGVTGAAACSGTPVTLSGSGAASGDKYKWYDAASGGTLLKTSANDLDNTYTTDALTSTTDYWVSIITSAGCESVRTSVTATVNPLPVSSVSGKQNISCYAGSDGTITVQGVGGTPPYQYSISNGAPWSPAIPTSGSYTFTGLNATTQYRIRAIDANGCTSAAVP